jgi:succinate dehydrogenase/fumarate reductase flavoprotein subunit
VNHDVVVLGTGAAGLVAALAASDSGASVGLYEKGDVVGGTTALSGGIVWIPNNPLAATAGIADSRAEALAYLDSLSLGMTDPDLVAALVDTGPELLGWLTATTPLRLQVAVGFPDYHPDHPGGKPAGGRSLDPDLFAFERLGAWAQRVARPPNLPRLNLLESPLGGGSGTIDPAVLQERVDHDVRGRGQALVGALLEACLGRSIEPVTGARATELVIEGGQVRGVRFESGDVATAERGVVVAVGGFEWDRQLVEAFLRGPMTSPTTIPTNTGDGLRMMMRAGAALGVMSEAWWVPTIEVPGEELYGHQRARLILRERTLPGSIMVNRRGRRFADEAANYNALGGALHQFDPSRFQYANLPCWLVFDQAYLRRYGFVTAGPGDDAPPWVTSAATLLELGTQLGIDAAGLDATVTRWNELVLAGHDDDFGRGDNAYDRWNGDQRSLDSATATIGTLTEPPFHAVEIRSGTLGTKGGARTDVDGQVLDLEGGPIDGLYAAGNSMAAVTAMIYGGGGGTLGPAMVFGYRAGRHAARSRR